MYPNKQVVVRGCKANEPILPGPDWGQDKFEWFSRGFTFELVDSNNGVGDGLTEEGMLFTNVREWRLNLETLEVKERDVTGTEYSMDFPMINEGFTGLKHQYGYTQVIDSIASSNAGNLIMLLFCSVRRLINGRNIRSSFSPSDLTATNS